MEGNDRQRTSEHNGPDKDIFRRPERYIENMHYQNTRFQDFQDCSGQGRSFSNRETNRQRSPEFRTANQHRQENVYAAPRQEVRHNGITGFQDYYIPRPTEYRPLSQQPSLVTDRQTHTRSDRTVNNSNPKLPAFNGKDDWKVWINRFEAIARRRSWTDEEKLDELLPRIQGEAGDFVFTQLPTGVLERYTELVRELSYRYRVIENEKSFKARFARRNQKPGEKAEEYAAELKRLHHKAYPNRDRQQRKEDLLERFMRGILDEEVRFFVNYVKKPDDIDEDHKNKEIKNSETSNQNDNQNKEVIQQLLDRIKVLETQIQGVDSKSEPRKPIVCYNCNQPGHIRALELEKELVIAEIEDECLLGMDILQNDPSGPADVILSRGIIILRGVEIPVIQVGVDRARRVISADHYEIPGYTEAVIDIYIERREEDDNNVNTEFFIEPASNFEERYSLQMAATLVDIKDMVTNQIRVMNPYPTSASINQDAILAYAERQEGETRFFAIEDFQSNMHEADNNAIRRIQFPEHTIDTGDAVPIKQHPRRVPLAYAEAEKEAIIELQKKGIIRESSSPWASPIVLVKKKNGKMRPCIDFRRVNLVTRNVSAFPLPRITDCINAVAGSTFFSSLDLTSSYYQIPVKKQDIQKTAFCTKYGHFEFLTMPMGLNGSAATFQRTMELILQGLQWTTAIIYIDDIVVFGTTLEEHLNRLTEVLKRIMDANLKLQPEKCELLQKTITFLGHQVSAEGVKPCHQNIAKILQWPTPFNIKQVKHILGMGSFYRRFVKNYADIVRPMTDLTKKGKKFVWTDQCETAFHRIKQELTGANIMGHPNNADEFILDVDASGTGIGAVLQQVQEGEKEQYLLGRKFKIRSDHQALIWLFRLKEPRGRIARWIEVLSAYNFSIEYRAGKKMGHADALSRCDNPHDCECPNIDTQEPLKCGPCKKCQKRAEEMILETPDKRQETPNLIVEGEISQDKDISKKAESREVINGDGQELIAEGTHIMQNSARGVQTRNQAQKNIRDTTDSKTAKTNIENWPTVCNTTLAKAQQEDQYFKPIYEGLKADKRPTKEEMVISSPETRHYWIIWDTLCLINDVIIRKLSENFQKWMEQGTIISAHDCILSGHLGSKRTAQKLLQKYYWYNLKEEVNNYIMRCDICEANKFPQKKPKAPLGSLLTGAPLDCLATDILGPLPTTPRNNKYVLVVTDHFTKWVEIFPVPNQNAETCASVILNEVIARFGSPLSIHSDQGRNYESNIFKELCRMLEVRKTRTSSKNPKGNAVAERFNKTLVRMIKAYLRGQQENWDLNLGCLASAYRSTVHASTGMTPNLLMLGREVRIPAELAYGSTTKYIPQDITSYGEYVDYLKEHMQIAHDVARKHLGSEARRHKEIYDSKISVYKYEQGDLVWYLNENRIKGVAPKLEKTYSGPYIIKRKMSELNFVLQLARDGTEKLIHHNKLKPYKGDNPPKWLLTVKRKLKNQ
ncbi:unnamed protein product [Mytilus edulis]|uniref:Reverse transcriptase n=1 Tax=Mytilus edulis TaxID=6550 RepID=A0A8S3RSZ6_MYTED|nr:unnamed protein product [Mytilus edulis]